MRSLVVLICSIFLRCESAFAQDWTLQTSGISGSVHPTSITFGNGRFVMGTTGKFSAPENAVAWSENGYDWHPATTQIFGSAVVEFFDGYFYALQGGVVFRSLDGDAWTFIVIAPQNVSVARLTATPHFIVGSSNSSSFAGVYFSPDGTNWSPKLLPQPSGGDYGVSYNIISGANRAWTFYNTKSASPQSGLVAVSFTGETWQNMASPVGQNSIQRLTYGNGRLLVSDYINVHVSTNLGETFETHPLPFDLAREINFAGGRFIGSLKLPISLDGITWGPASFPDQNISFSDVAYGNGRYVAVGGNDFAQENQTDWIAIWETDPPPIVSQHPQDRLAGVGRSTTFTVTLDHSANVVSHQWLHNGKPIPNATKATFNITQISEQDAGWYACEITDEDGTILSDPARLELVPADKVSRLSNLSVRGPAGIGSATFVSGFAIGGGSPAALLPLLIRGVGPTLKEFDVPNALTDPAIDIFRSDSSKVASNDNWDGNNSLHDEFTRLGAFLFNAEDSKDAAVLLDQLPPGPYSIHTLSFDGTEGIALSEVYDATQTIDATSPRLTNLSSRALAGAGADTLTGGFVISGETSMKVMIRAVGPGLSQFGVPGVLPNPQVTLRQHTGNGLIEIDINDDWSPDTREVQQQVGAFNLPLESRDAVLIAELAPGVYSAQVFGDTSQSGIVLLEIYEVP